MTATTNGDPLAAPVRLNGDEIKKALRIMGRTITDLAAAIHMNKGTLSRQLAAGSTPQIETVVYIWQAFGKRLELDEIVNIPGLTGDDLPDLELPGDPLESEDLVEVGSHPQ
jgi:hypothetical protein